MGFMRRAPPPPPPPTFFESNVVDAFGMPSWLAELSVFELSVFLTFVAFLLAVHVYGRITEMNKQAVLNMHALNRVNIFKECFLGYVNAGMLEPILAIASSDYDVSTKSLVINLAQLLGLFSWLYLLSDAFDISDTQQAFVYWDRVTSSLTEKDRPYWLKKSRAKREGSELRGSLFRDLSLWFMLFGSLAAFAGVVSHRDVIHSHAVVLMWLVLHHQSRAATAWRGTGYFHTLFAPSTALLPLEFCLNLIDQEMIGDDGLEDLEKWRKFIKAESGVDLIIEAHIVGE